MRKLSESKVRKILILASVLVLMLTLCGCRTRITNNDEVSNVMYDEEGWMKDEYDMRREDLGLDKAPKPIFTGFGTPDDEEYDGSEYGDDEDFMEDYDPEYDEYSDVDEPEPGSTTNEGDGARKRGTQSTVIKRNPTTTSKKDDTKVQVVLDAGTNGGTISKKKTITVNVEKGGTYSSLPSPDKRDGYTFKGWYTKKEDGTKVSKKTKVTVTKKHKLYAQWEKKGGEDEEKPAEKPAEKTKHKISFTGEEVDLPDIEVTEGDTYNLPEDITRDGYKFGGWYKDGKRIENGSVIDIKEDTELSAEWEAYPYWDEFFGSKKKDIKDGEPVPCYIDSGDKDVLDGFNTSIKDTAEDANYVIIVTGNMSKADELAGGYPDNPVIVVSKNALKSKNDNKSLYTKMLLLSKLYPDLDMQLDFAAKCLEIEESNDELVLSY